MGSKIGFSFCCCSCWLGLFLLLFTDTQDAVYCFMFGCLSGHLFTCLFSFFFFIIVWLIFIILKYNQAITPCRVQAYVSLKRLIVSGMSSESSDATFYDRSEKMRSPSIRNYIQYCVRKIHPSRLLSNLAQFSAARAVKSKHFITCPYFNRGCHHPGFLTSRSLSTDFALLLAVMGFRLLI